MSLSPKTAADRDTFFSASLAEYDPEIADAIGKELGRQRDEIELIASENIVSRAVLEAQGFRVEYVEERWARRLATVNLEGVRLIDNVPVAEIRTLQFPCY